jgi:enolase
VAEALEDGSSGGAIALDVAASHFFEDGSGTYILPTDGTSLSSPAMIARLVDWSERYPIISIEDGLAEDDWPAWAELTLRCPDLHILGDDLFVTDGQRLAKGVALGAANAILVKPNQAGTLSEAMEVISKARAAGYRTVVSARSGETEDAFLADLATGTAAGQIKVGSVTGSSRNAKWNQLLRIEEALGADAYLGAAALALGSLPAALRGGTDTMLSGGTP